MTGTMPRRELPETLEAPAELRRAELAARHSQSGQRLVTLRVYSCRAQHSLPETALNASVVAKSGLVLWRIGQASRWMATVAPSSD